LSERKRLGVLYKNVQTTLFIERADLEEFQKMMKKADKEIEDINAKLRKL